MISARLFRVAALLGCALLAGCASVPLAQHEATPDIIRQLRDSGMEKLRVGDFAPAASLPADRDKQLTIRGAAINPTDKKSFAQSLRGAVIADLKASGKYDEASTLELRGELTKNELQASGMSVGHGTMAARFRVMRAGQVVFDKVVEEQSSWDSSFVGVVAYTNGMNGYTDLNSKLLLRLYSDKDFIAACKAP